MSQSWQSVVVSEFPFTRHLFGIFPLDPGSPLWTDTGH